MSRIYTTKTPSLKATIADIRNLDTKKLTLNGKNILDYISDSEFDSYDTRDPQLKNDELDIWNTAISLSDNGHIEVKPHVHSVICNKETNYEVVYEGVTKSQLDILKTAVKVIDNEVLGANDEHIMYWQTDGLMSNDRMFMYCDTLESFSSDLSSLTDGSNMFNCCTQLTSFNIDLPKMTDGEFMFNCCNNLESFSSDLSSLTNGIQMFSNCDNLESFSSDLSSLTNGDNMFSHSYNLKSFTSDLSSLTNGTYMFTNCKLDTTSVANIVHTLPQRDAKPTTTEGDGNIYIGIGCDDTEEDQLLFAQECDCETWQELLNDFSAKNWTVYIGCNGRPTTTYNMRRGETLPIYTKLVEVTEGKHYAYTSADGTKFFNINYFHSTNGSTEGYDVFSSLEEAISTYNVTPKN